MVPAYVAVSIGVLSEKVKHAGRRRIGNKKLRAICCDENPSRFPDGTAANDVPAMKDKLERTSTVFAGYCPVYCCRVCGQEWIEEWEQQGFDGIQTLSKFSGSRNRR